MIILALDPATVLGYAQGKPGGKPESGSVRLKGPDEHREMAAFNALAFLRSRWIKTKDRPDLVCIEALMNPVWQKSADAILLQTMIYGAIVAMCQAYGIRYEVVPVATWRKHYLGRPNLGERAATKAAVISRGIVLGYLPRDCKDSDRADAVGLWDYAAAVYGRARPKEMVMF